MKVKTKHGLIAIFPENDMEASFLCLWQAELSRTLEEEGINLDELNRILEIYTHLDGSEQ